MTAPVWNSRIVGEGDVDPRTLAPHAQNWRLHSKRQTQAIRRALGAIGWVQRVIVNRQTGRIVDGHARVAAAIDAGQTSVPVLYVDLTDADEAAALATFDRLGALAAPDPEAVRRLMAAAPGMAALMRAVHKVAPVTADAPPVGDVAPITLRAVPAFAGCYALHGRAGIDVARLKTWKAGNDPALTERIAREMADAWSARHNAVASVTMPPPSAARGRDYETHPMWQVCTGVASAIGVPAVQAFAPRERFAGRGVGRHKETLAPLVCREALPAGAVLVLDDAITTRRTITQMRDALVTRGHAVFAIAWVGFAL